MNYRSFHVGQDQDILIELLTLHSPVADPAILDTTWGLGTMWKGTSYRPLAADRDSTKRPQVVADFRALPFAAESFDVVVFDPPHLPDAGTVENHYAHHYGLTTDVARQANSVAGFFAPFLAEAQRILRPGGIILAKIADLVHNHHYQWQHVDFIQAVRAMSGLTACDVQIKGYPEGSRMTSSKWQKRHHLRNAHCYWIVVRKGSCEGRGDQLWSVPIPQLPMFS